MLNCEVNVSKYATIYVAPDGSDTTGDGTEEKPFFTIQRAVNVLGEITQSSGIKLKAGTYNYANEDFYLHDNQKLQ